MWGDYAIPRIEPANRVDRFLAGVAYLDGRRPSAVFARGYYTRSTLVAYDWDGRRLARALVRRQWPWTPMTNPFNDTPHGRDGTDPEFDDPHHPGLPLPQRRRCRRRRQARDRLRRGHHRPRRHLLYSSFATLPAGSRAPGTSARLGHGDAMHVTDIDPDRPGLEIFTVHENARLRRRTAWRCGRPRTAK